MIRRREPHILHRLEPCFAPVGTGNPAAAALLDSVGNPARPHPHNVTSSGVTGVLHRSTAAAAERQWGEVTRRDSPGRGLHYPSSASQTLCPHEKKEKEEGSPCVNRVKRKRGGKNRTSHRYWRVMEKDSGRGPVPPPPRPARLPPPGTSVPIHVGEETHTNQMAAVLISPPPKTPVLHCDFIGCILGIEDMQVTYGAASK